MAADRAVEVARPACTTPRGSVRMALSRTMSDLRAERDPGEIAWLGGIAAELHSRLVGSPANCLQRHGGAL